jgi:pimeloyl-ACP methyl ester carboxylesterase
MSRVDKGGSPAGGADLPCGILSAMPPSLNVDLLTRHSSYVEEDVLEWTFLMAAGNEELFAILDRPARGSPRGPGFVVCHSYGEEFVTLRRVERAVARTLAREGHPVLSFHRSGFGDSSGSLADATVDRQVVEIRAAMDRLASETGVVATGLVGARFGALMAGLAAAGGGVDHLLLMNPVFRSGPYFRNMMKQTRLMAILDVEVPGERTVDEYLQTLQHRGVIDLHGLPLYRHLFEDLEPVDLADALGNVAARTLILQTTRRSIPPASVLALAEGIHKAGGECSIELVPEPPGVVFGQKTYMSTADPTVRTDVMRPVIERMCERAGAWVRG